MADEKIDLGDVLEQVVDITNDGPVKGTQDIELLIDSTVKDTVSGLTVDSGISTTKTLSWDSSAGSSQQYTVTVQSDDDSFAYTLEVVNPTGTDYYLIDITGTNDPVEKGETLSIDSLVDNVGDQSGTQDVDLKIDGTIVDTATGISLGADGTQTTSLSWDSSGSTLGNKTARIETVDDFDEKIVEVEAPPGEVLNSENVIYVTNGDVTPILIFNPKNGDYVEFTDLNTPSGYCRVSDDGAILDPGEDNYVQIDTATKKRVTSINAYSSADVYRSATTDDNETVIVTSAGSNKVKAYDTTTTNLLWSNSLGSGAANIVIGDDNNYAYLQSDSAVTQLNVSDGSTGWSDSLSNSSPMVKTVGDNVYAGTGSDSLNAYDKSNGTLLFTITNTSSVFRLATTDSNSHVAIKSGNSGVLEFRVSDQTKTVDYTSSEVVNSIAYGPEENDIIAVSDDGLVESIDRSTETQNWGVITNSSASNTGVGVGPNNL